MRVDEKFVGSKTETIKITLTEQFVKDYVHAIDDRSESKSTITIPSTIPFLFWSHFSVPWLEGKGPLIHGEQRFDYKKSLQINETYDCYIVFTKVYQKRNLQFLEHDMYIMKLGEEIAISSSKFIIISGKEEARS